MGGQFPNTVRVLLRSRIILLGAQPPSRGEAPADLLSAATGQRVVGRDACLNSPSPFLYKYTYLRLFLQKTHQGHRDSFLSLLSVSPDGDSLHHHGTLVETSKPVSVRIFNYTHNLILMSPAFPLTSLLSSGVWSRCHVASHSHVSLVPFNLYLSLLAFHDFGSFEEYSWVFGRLSLHVGLSDVFSYDCPENTSEARSPFRPVTSGGITGIYRGFSYQHQRTWGQ